MANSPQARKRAKQSEKARMLNRMQMSTMRTTIKSFLKAIEASDKDKATEAFRAASSFIDRAARKGLHKKNKAARLKARLNTRLKELV